MKLGVATRLLLTLAAAGGGTVFSSRAHAPQHDALQKAEAMLPGFSSCLLTMDDGNRLSEWLAFHYHVLKLRNLIVMVDPRSETSPSHILERWNDKMMIEEWSDEDVFTKEQLEDKSAANLVRLHRARQRLFNVQCMKQLRVRGASWTIMTDTDEYAYVNPRLFDPNDSLFIPSLQPHSPDHEGSVLELLDNIQQSNDLSLNKLHLNTACYPLPRLQFGGIESTAEEIDNEFPSSLMTGTPLRAQGFDTFRWRHYGSDVVTSRNGTLPGKTIIDLSRIQGEDVSLFSGDPHRPIDRICDPKNVWINEAESLFVANHILGSIEEYSFRYDARFKFRVMTYEDRKNVGGHVSDEARLWLKGFVESLGVEEASRLLEGVGKELVRSSSDSTTTISNLPGDCSISFFGLPRSFKTMVLPSIVENVLLPNAKYNCDLFVHYYDLEEEDAGRFNRGGAINASEIEALQSAIEVVASHHGMPKPTVRFISESKSDFDVKHGAMVQHYQTDRNPDGTLKYFPWAEKSYTSGKQLENVVMQWHSIESVWNLMTDTSEELNKHYERVAFLRSDVHFATPIDMFQVDNDTPDLENHFAVVPGFGKHPVNDRMIYGPFDAVKVWATKRFELLEEHIRTYEPQGYGMHSERFMNHTLLPAIAKMTGVSVKENIDTCFYRVRPGDSLIMSDCNDHDGGSTRGIGKVNEQARAEAVLDRLCQLHNIPGVRFQELRCDESIGMDERRRRMRNARRMQNTENTLWPTSGKFFDTSIEYFWCAFCSQILLFHFYVRSSIG